MPEIVMPAEAAKALRISTETLRAYAEEGRIPFVSTPGGHRRYVIEDVKHALMMERAVTIAPLEEGDQGIRLASETPADPIKRAPRWRARTLAAMASDVEADAGADVLAIPFIGKPGTSRFIVGQDALA